MPFVSTVVASAHEIYATVRTDKNGILLFERVGRKSQCG